VGKRHQARELALKVLFQLEGGEDDVDEVLRYHAAEGVATPDVANFAGQLVRGVLANREKLDAILSEASEHWKLDQMAKVDRIILRIAVYEVAIDRRVPTKAAINESIELAKTFSGDEAGRFVNGILGRVAQGVTATSRPASAN
jgi:transcription antitermination protein NusB